MTPIPDARLADLIDSLEVDEVGIRKDSDTAVALRELRDRRQQRAVTREALAALMLRNGLATGHGDTVEDLLAELEPQIAALMDRVGQQRAAGWMPKEPPMGLLVSMAIRYDHGLGVPGYYDQLPFAKFEADQHNKRMASTITTMRQLYEEVSGYGFYSPAKEAEYAALLEAIDAALTP